MARFYPEYETILNDKKDKPTAGELHLLSLLRQLDDSFEVYYQAHINIANPDVVIIKPGCGVLIIEVKDWNLDYYTYAKPNSIDNYGTMYLKKNNVPICTPFQQAAKYKDELYNLLCPSLFFGTVQDSKTYGIVISSVYYYGTSSQEVAMFFGASNKIDSKSSPKSYAKFIKYWCRDDDNRIIREIRNILFQKNAFTDELYQDVHNIFALSDSINEQREPFVLEGKQKDLAECNPGTKRRMNGVAGSGKTLVIAQKAINCWKMKHERVLVLSFNITIKNYIRDKIAQNTRDMSQRERSEAFELAHFQMFLSENMKKYSLKDPGAEAFKDAKGIINWDNYQHYCMTNLKKIKSDIRHYKTILIDEAQDYRYEWFEFLKDVFMDEDTETLIGADEKQNIYGNVLDPSDRKVRTTGFGTGWNKLESSWRMSTYNYSLCIDFQRKFLLKYETDAPPTQQISMNDITSVHYYYPIFPVENIEAVEYRIIQQVYRLGHGISPNDICVVSSSVDPLRVLDWYIKGKTGPNSTSTIFETQEEYSFLRARRNIDNPSLTKEKRELQRSLFKQDLETIRNIKKYAFNMNAGVLKLCTIHSFKGWEINTVIIVLNPDDTPEMFYTALTRAKQNIIVINNGNQTYDNWLRTNFEVQTVPTMENA